MVRISYDPDKRIGVSEKIGFGLGDFGSNIVFQMVMMFLPFFYTDVFGISAAAMAALFLYVRIADAVTDPIMGSICDRTSTRWGKFRPYLVGLCVPYAILAVLTFTTPELDDEGKFWWAVITYGLLMQAYTAINIPYCALGGVITADNEERLSFSSYRFFLATCAAVLIASALPRMVDYLGNGNEQKGYQYSMVIFAMGTVLSFLACFFLTKERVQQSAKMETSFKEDLKYLLKNDQWAILLLVNIVLLVALVIRGSTSVYYVKWYMGREDLVAAFLTTGTVAMGIGAALASTVARFIPHVRLFALCQLVMFASSAAQKIIPASDLVLLFSCFALTQFFAQMGVAVLWTMLADTVDYGEYKTGRRVTGLSFSGQLFGIKIGVALGGTASAALLGYWGYQEGGVDSQSDEAIQGILILFTIIPAVLHIPVAMLTAKFSLTRERTREIREELDRRTTEES